MVNNPILQAMNKQTQQVNNPMVNAIMNGGNPNQIYNDMMQNNPQFRQFVQETHGLTPMQIVQKYGGNPNILNMIR